MTDTNDREMTLFTYAIGITMILGCAAVLTLVM